MNNFFVESGHYGHYGRLYSSHIFIYLFLNILRGGNPPFFLIFWWPISPHGVGVKWVTWVFFKKHLNHSIFSNGFVIKWTKMYFNNNNTSFSDNKNIKSMKNAFWNKSGLDRLKKRQISTQISTSSARKHENIKKWRWPISPLVTKNTILRKVYKKIKKMKLSFDLRYLYYRIM